MVFFLFVFLAFELYKMKPYPVSSSKAFSFNITLGGYIQDSQWMPETTKSCIPNLIYKHQFLNSGSDHRVGC
jgi:hypothetical protein